MPKSRSRTWPSAVTSTLEGLRSRCTTSRPWACATAASTWRKSSSRARSPSADRRGRARRWVAPSRTPGRGRALHSGRRRRRGAGRCWGGARVARISRSRSSRWRSGSAIHETRGQLEGDGPAGHHVRSLGQPHRPHAALAQRPEEPVGADAVRAEVQAGTGAATAWGGAGACPPGRRRPSRERRASGAGGRPGGAPGRGWRARPRARARGGPAPGRAAGRPAPRSPG